MIPVEGTITVNCPNGTIKYRVYGLMRDQVGRFDPIVWDDDNKFTTLSSLHPSRATWSKFCDPGDCESCEDCD